MQQQRLLVVIGVAALFVGGVIAVVAGVRGGDAEVASVPPPATPEPPPETAAPPPATPKRVAVPLRGLRGYDPEGDGRERDETAPLATDGNPSTAWQSENYRSFFKDGVGLLLDAGQAVALTRIVVQTGTPGITAAIRVGAGPDGPFATVTASKRLARTTTFTPRPRRGRYVVLWIEDIPGGGTADIGEVRAWRAGSAS